MTREIDYGIAIRRNWRIAAAVLLAALLVTAIVTWSRDRVYESSAQLVVAPTAGPMDQTDVIRAVEALDRRTVVATFARMATTAAVRDFVAKRLDITPERVAQFTTRASVIPSTNVIRVDVQGPDARVAAQIANTTAIATAREAESLYRIFTLRLLSMASAPERALYPDPGRNFLIGSALGVFFGLAAALAVERLRQ